MKRTVLYDAHCKLGGKMIDFGGWELPIQYTSILEEHQQVRSSAGLFDVSHMGEINVKGPDAEKFIQKLITNDISKLQDCQIIYSPMCYPNGGVVDDVLIYKLGQEGYLIVVNASNTLKDYEWMLENLIGNVEVTDVSAEYAQLAIQGPQAEQILQKLVQEPLSEIRFFKFKKMQLTNGIQVLISRTGYTGEDGFEVYLPPKQARGLWDNLLKEGKEDGLVAVGLGARDTLRFEAALPLYGHEISENITPFEGGLSWFVKLDKPDFIGKEALVHQKEQGINRKLVGFEMIERGIPRSNYEVQANREKIGFVTSGNAAPTLKKNIGLALINKDYSEQNTEIDIIIRNKKIKAKIIKTPFYTKKYKK